MQTTLIKLSQRHKYDKDYQKTQSTKTTPSRLHPRNETPGAKPDSDSPVQTINQAT